MTLEVYLLVTLGITTLVIGAIGFLTRLHIRLEKELENV